MAAESRVRISESGCQRRRAPAAARENGAANWHVAGVGDYNGDGTGDIIWRDDAGNIGEWVMSNGVRIANINLGSNPTTWHNVDHHYDLL